MQVNLSAATGDMGILANHVPSIEPLRPGVVEVIDSTSNSQKWFGASFVTTNPVRSGLMLIALVLVSGGFANVHPNNKLTINAVEAAPLDNFSIEVRAKLLCCEAC